MAADATAGSWQLSSSIHGVTEVFLAVVDALRVWLFTFLSARYTVELRPASMSLSESASPLAKLVLDRRTVQLAPFYRSPEITWRRVGVVHLAAGSCLGLTPSEVQAAARATVPFQRTHSWPFESAAAEPLLRAAEQLVARAVRELPYVGTSAASWAAASAGSGCARPNDDSNEYEIAAYQFCCRDTARPGCGAYGVVHADNVHAADALRDFVPHSQTAPLQRRQGEQNADVRGESAGGGGAHDQSAECDEVGARRRRRQQRDALLCEHVDSGRTEPSRVESDWRREQRDEVLSEVLSGRVHARRGFNVWILLEDVGHDAPLAFAELSERGHSHDGEIGGRGSREVAGKEEDPCGEGALRRGVYELHRDHRAAEERCGTRLLKRSAHDHVTFRAQPAMQPGDAYLFETWGPRAAYHAGVEREPCRHGARRRSVEVRVLCA
jgi:hypothetical protein